MTDYEHKTERGAITSNDLSEVTRFAGSLIVLVLGALMLAEGVVKSVTKTAIFFPSVDGNFEFVVGFIVLVFAASIMSMNRSRLFAVQRRRHV